MDTTTYLKQLDYGQLMYAKEVAERLLKEKDAEPRIPIWVVGTDVRTVGGFRKDDYAKAVQRVHEAADYSATFGGGFSVDLELLNIKESEVGYYLESEI